MKFDICSIRVGWLCGLPPSTPSCATKSVSRPLVSDWLIAQQVTGPWVWDSNAAGKLSTCKTLLQGHAVLTEGPESLMPTGDCDQLVTYSDVILRSFKPLIESQVMLGGTRRSHWTSGRVWATTGALLRFHVRATVSCVIWTKRNWWS